MKNISSFILFLFIALFSCQNITAQDIEQQIANPTGEIANTTADDLWPKLMERDRFNEFWNFQLYFDNGMKAHIVFSAAKFGRLNVTGARVSFYGLDDSKVYQLAREYPIENLELDKENFILNLNPRQNNVWFGGELPNDFRIYINTAKDGERFKVDLQFDEIHPGFKWDDGLFRVQNEHIGIMTHIPFARVSGTIGINENVQEVTGTGYMDNTFQNDTTVRLMHSGYRFVSHVDSENWHTLYFLRPKEQQGRQTIGYRLKSVDGEVSLNGINGIINQESGRAFRESIPSEMTLFLDNHSTLRIERVLDQERFSVLSDLSWVARRAARLYLGGDVIDIRGTAKLHNYENETTQGDYNFFIVD